MPTLAILLGHATVLVKELVSALVAQHLSGCERRPQSLSWFYPLIRPVRSSRSAKVFAAIRAQVTFKAGAACAAAAAAAGQETADRQ
jgi:hypothetical protein